jgi:hypothetical protein
MWARPLHSAPMTFGGALADTVDLVVDRRRILGAWRSGALPHAEAHLTNRPVRFVVIETRTFARPPELAPDEANHTVLLPRGPAEPLEAFSLRATQKVLALERDRQTIRLMLVLLTPRFDARAAAARLMLVRALMAQAAAQPEQPTELVLSTDDDGDPKVQSELMALVDLMLREPNSWSLPIQIKFRAARELDERTKHGAAQRGRAAPASKLRFWR